TSDVFGQLVYEPVGISAAVGVRVAHVQGYLVVRVQRRPQLPGQLVYVVGNIYSYGLAAEGRDGVPVVLVGMYKVAQARDRGVFEELPDAGRAPGVGALEYAELV